MTQGSDVHVEVDFRNHVLQVWRLILQMTCCKFSGSETLLRLYHQGTTSEHKVLLILYLFLPLQSFLCMIKVSPPAVLLLLLGEKFAQILGCSEQFSAEL